MSAEAAVLNYKRLAEVERACRTLKGVDLQVRPIRHRLEARVKAHIFLTILAYYVQWHMAEAWKPLLFADEMPPDADRERDPVAPAKRSKAALAKVHMRKKRVRRFPLPQTPSRSNVRLGARAVVSSINAMCPLIPWQPKELLQPRKMVVRANCGNAVL